MRQIILDTETTGLEWKKGNRIVEIGCVELIERRPSGRNFHRYLKPDCAFEAGAQEIVEHLIGAGHRLDEIRMLFEEPDQGILILGEAEK